MTTYECPDLDNFSPFKSRGWSIFETRSKNGDTVLHAVFRGRLPCECVHRESISDHIMEAPRTFENELSHQASKIETHTETCPQCRQILALARDRAMQI